MLRAGEDPCYNSDKETKKAEKEDEEDEVITTYKVDGEEVEEKPFKKYYQD